ncbi:GIY-YIG nuclease family protein [Streptomyces sp. NPDC087307]|uniref:GIY-YIG nuclease family protein n=1 Tax=Streptomyces sp. NPDC087307 TaxID=3365782 RepID=UPI0038269F90
MSVRDNRPSRPQDQSCVYVIGSPTSSLVKLGTTTQLSKRLRALQLSSPVSLEVLWSAPGDRGTETALHQRFAPFRRHGEWFDFGDEDPVHSVQEALETNLLPTQQAGKIASGSLCACGHALSFHQGVCTVGGWDEWLDCQCGRFVLAPDWHVGMPDCDHCGHWAKDHRGAHGPCTWEGDMWRHCRCHEYARPQTTTAAGAGVAR